MENEIRKDFLLNLKDKKEFFATLMIREEAAKEMLVQVRLRKLKSY